METLMLIFDGLVFMLILYWAARDDAKPEAEMTSPFRYRVDAPVVDPTPNELALRRAARPAKARPWGGNDA